jgi:hypothetical protein
VVQPAPVYVLSPGVTTTTTTTSAGVASSGWFGSSAVGSASGSTGVVLPQPQRAEEYPVAQAPQPRMTTGADLGMTYLQLGDGDSALRVLLEHIRDYPNDTEAVRAIAIAYLIMGEGDNGVRQIGRAYRLSPWLASRPLTGLLAPEDHAYALDLATHAAARHNSPDAWLTVAVMMQASERHSAARHAIQRARAAGLNASVVEPFLTSLPVDGN